MQYGNNKDNTQNYVLIWFKSYYVVWKLNIDKTMNNIEKQFKSYYVVWKRYIIIKRLKRNT